MFKIIELKDFSYLGEGDDMFGSNYCESEELKKNILASENFERTLAGIGLTNVLDLEKRSSWTHKSKFDIYFNMQMEVLEFMEKNNILTYKDGMKYASFSLLKYEKGDFFLNHRDSNLSNKIDGVHEYTCLIFCPYGEDYETLEGGELILKHPEGLYEIKFDPAVETRRKHFVMVIFSIDMYHEVLPIIKGTRYVFKQPLFVKTKTETTTSFEARDIANEIRDIANEILMDCSHDYDRSGDY